MTHGFAGMPVAKPVIFGVHFDGRRGRSTISACSSSSLALWLTRNLLRSPTGRAWVAIRDSEIAAQSMGVNLALYKTMAFAYSAALMGLAGALFAHKIAYLAPDIFTILLSIQFLLLVIVGGLGSLHGAVFGAIFVALLPPVIAILRDSIPRHHGRRGRRPPASASIGVVGEADRRLPQEARRRGRHLRPDPGAGHPVRAARHLRPLAEDQALLLDLPAVQAPPPSSARRATCGRSGCDELLRGRATSSIHFGGIRAVDGVSFAVEQGEVFTIIGPNGAGKTTIFNLISRIYEPTAGRLCFDGTRHHRRAAAPDRRPRHRAHLPEHRAVRACDAAAEPAAGRHAHTKSGFFSELLFLPSVRRMELEHREAVEKVIDFLDLQHYRDSLIANLPYGVRKVVELARALCTEPKLLLLDEPSSGLNVEETEDMAFWIEDIQQPARHHRADGRARHDPGLGRVRPRAGAELRPGARHRHAGRGAGPSRSHPRYLGMRWTCTTAFLPTLAWEVSAQRTEGS